MQNLWTKVDCYTEQNFGLDLFDEVIEACAEARLPDISITPTQGQLLNILVRMCNAQNVLEIGTLGGYSTLWLASAIPDSGRLVTLEADSRHARVAEDNFKRYQSIAPIIEIRVGQALATLSQLEQEQHPPFDFFFIDADKRNNAKYVEWALKLARPGSIIVIDNVIRNGAVIHETSSDEGVEGVWRMNEFIGSERRLQATSIQTVGSKGYDGFTIAHVLGT